MNNIPENIMSEEDKRSLSIAYLQFYALLILLLGYIFNLKSSKENIELIFRKYINYDTPEPEPLQTALIGSGIFSVAILIFVYIAYNRQQDLDEAYNNELVTDEIYKPSSNLTKVTILGSFATLVAFLSIIKLISVQQPSEPIEAEEFDF